MGTLKKSVVLAVGFVGMFVGSARAQEDTLAATIPFDFVVRGEHFTAGRYEIVDAQGLITIEGRDSRRAGFAMATPAGGQDPRGREPALVFIHSDGRYTLSQVWESDERGLTIAARSDRGRQVGALRPSSEAPTVISAENMK